jgi:hypothetical protein
VSQAAASAGATAPLDLHGDLYRPEAVERAVAAFAALASCTVERHGPYLRVHLSALGGRDAALLKRHLANWALAASVAGRA